MATAINSYYNILAGLASSQVLGTAALVTSTAGTITLSPATHAGAILVSNIASGCTITPPAATGTGNVYEILIGTTITSNSTTIDAKAGNSSDVFMGLATIGATTSGSFATASNSNLITFNGGTTAGVLGTYVVMTDIATHQWLVQVFGVGSGTASSCFSNH